MVTRPMEALFDEYFFEKNTQSEKKGVDKNTELMDTE